MSAKSSPGQTVMIDFKQLRDSQTPDSGGNLIPLTMDSGQASWTMFGAGNKQMSGRSEQVNTVIGISSTYACYNCCPDNVYSTGRAIPFAVQAEAGQSYEYFVEAEGLNCYGQVNGPLFLMVGDTWLSSNTTVATIANDGNSLAIAPGTVTFSGGFNSTRYDYDGRDCYESNSRENGEGEMQVTSTFTLNVPATAADGTTVTYSITPQDGTPTAIQWSFTAPTAAGNNPMVDFSAPTAATTTALAHWFALPNDPCTAAANARYEIKAKVTFQNGEVTKSKFISVNGFWDPAGVTPEPEVTGFPAIDLNPTSGVYYVAGVGTLSRNPRNPVYYLPTTNQFYNKVQAHENKHDQQWRTGMLSDILQPSSFLQVISNFTNTSRPALAQQIINAFQPWKNSQEQIYINRKNAAEIEAYGVSDSVAPMYLYQRCGRTNFPLLEIKEGEWFVAY